MKFAPSDHDNSFSAFTLGWWYMNVKQKAPKLGTLSNWVVALWFYFNNRMEKLIGELQRRLRIQLARRSAWSDSWARIFVRNFNTLARIQYSRLFNFSFARMQEKAGRKYSFTCNIIRELLAYFLVHGLLGYFGCSFLVEKTFCWLGDESLDQWWDVAFERNVMCVGRCG